MKNRIVRFSKFGGPEVLQVKDFDLPEPQDNQVQIKTHFEMTEKLKMKPTINRCFI